MATEITRYLSNRGLVFNTLEAAERDDLLAAIVDALEEGGGYNDDFNPIAAAEELLKHFRVEKLEQPK